MYLGLDLDGCLYRWTESARDTFRELRGIEIDEYGEDTHWNHIRDFITDDDWHWLWNSRDARKRMFRTGRAYADGVAAARALEKLCKVVVVTKRPSDVMADTMAWLSAHRLNPHGVITVGGGEKHEHPFLMDAYVDDNPDNVEMIEAHRGVPVFVPKRAYNADVRESKLVTPFDDWNEVIRWVEYRV